MCQCAGGARQAEQTDVKKTKTGQCDCAYLSASYFPLWLSLSNTPRQSPHISAAPRSSAPSFQTDWRLGLSFKEKSVCEMTSRCRVNEGSVWEPGFKPQHSEEQSLSLSGRQPHPDGIWFLWMSCSRFIFMINSILMLLYPVTCVALWAIVIDVKQFSTF